MQRCAVAQASAEAACCAEAHNCALGAAEVAWAAQPRCTAACGELGWSNLLTPARRLLLSTARSAPKSRVRPAAPRYAALLLAVLLSLLVEPAGSNKPLEPIVVGPAGNVLYTPSAGSYAWQVSSTNFAVGAGVVATSADLRFSAVLQANGSFVIQDACTGSNLLSSSFPPSSSGTCATLNLQGDGNLVCRTTSNDAAWAFGAASGSSVSTPYALIMQLDGNLVVYGGTAASSWPAVSASGTSRPNPTRGLCGAGDFSDTGATLVSQVTNANPWSIGFNSSMKISYTFNNVLTDYGYLMQPSYGSGLVAYQIVNSNNVSPKSNVNFYGFGGYLVAYCGVAGLGAANLSVTQPNSVSYPDVYLFSYWTPGACPTGTPPMVITAATYPRIAGQTLTYLNVPNGFPASTNAAGPVQPQTLSVTFSSNALGGNLTFNGQLIGTLGYLGAGLYGIQNGAACGAVANNAGRYGSLLVRCGVASNVRVLETPICFYTVTIVDTVFCPPPPPSPPAPPSPPSPPPAPPPPPWIGPSCPYGEDHKFAPNAAGTVANGTLLSSRLVIDQTGNNAAAWVMSAGSGVTYDGTSLSFDGSTNAWVSFGSSITFGGSPYSVSVWFKYRSLNNANGDSYSRVLDFQPQASSTSGLILAHEGNTSTFGLIVGGGGGAQTLMPPIVINTWYHVVVAVTPPSTVAVYLNGVAVQFARPFPTVASSSSTFSYVAGFGKSSWSDNGFFTGNIGEFRFFSRTLGPADAAALYAGNACSPPPPAAAIAAVAASQPTAAQPVPEPATPEPAAATSTPAAESAASAQSVTT